MRFWTQIVVLLVFCGFPWAQAPDSAQADTSDTARAKSVGNKPKITTPTNISELNSSASDYAPFIMPDGRTIYFSSSREGGYGGEDIYYSTLENGYWSSPKNLGPPINSRYNEGAMCLSPDGRTMYITICGLVPHGFCPCGVGGVRLCALGRLRPRKHKKRQQNHYLCQNPHSFNKPNASAGGKLFCRGKQL